MVRIRIKLSTLLGERRMKQSELAELTGITPATINHYYHEDVERINIGHLCMICEALKCHLCDLLVEEEVDGDTSTIADYRNERDVRQENKGRKKG